MLLDRAEGAGGDPQREAVLMGLAAEHGLRVPRVEQVRHDGLVLERIDGPTMAKPVQP